MSNVVKKSLNKGIPVWAPLDIRAVDLASVSDNKEEIDKLIQKHFDKYMEFLRSFGNYPDLSFFQTLMIIIDKETLERHIIFSPSGFVSSLYYNLNVNNICKNPSNVIDTYCLMTTMDSIFDDCSQSLKERITVLKSMHRPDELRKEFPLLYEKYQEMFRKSTEAKQFAVKINRLSREQKRQFIRRFDMEQKKLGITFKKYMDKYLNFNFDSFINGYITFFDCLIENGPRVIEYLLSNPIDISNLDIFDQRKLELFFASQYLTMARVLPNEYKQDYLYYVSNYFSDHSVLETDLSIVIGKDADKRFNYFASLGMKEEGYILTPQILYKNYREVLIDNPNLRAVDFSNLDFSGMNSEEVKKFLDDYLKDISVNWDFLLPDDLSYEKKVIEKIKASGTNMSEEDRKKHQERLWKLFMAKKELYDSSAPLFRIKGKNTFDGYIGHVYPNGRVVLDKFYDDTQSKILADGYAVYAMGIEEFYELSRLSRSEIIRNKLCRRYIHKGDWADRVLENEILVGGENISQVKARRLIKEEDKINV